MIRNSQPLPDLPTSPSPSGDYAPQRLRMRAYKPAPVPTVNPADVAACDAAWGGLDEDSLRTAAGMSANPGAYLKRMGLS